MTAHSKIIMVYHQGIATAVSQLNQQHTRAHPDGFIPPQMSQTMHRECQRFNTPFFLSRSCFSSLFLLSCSVLPAFPTGIKKSVPPAQAQ